jgi:hypothetical protein
MALSLGFKKRTCFLKIALEGSSDWLRGLYYYCGRLVPAGSAFLKFAKKVI